MLWGGVPLAMQERILRNAFCAKCNTPVKLVNYYGMVENGGLILEGDCAVCGHAAARVIEPSPFERGNN